MNVENFEGVSLRVAAEIYARFMAEQRSQLTEADMFGKATFARRAGEIFAQVMGASIPKTSVTVSVDGKALQPRPVPDTSEAMAVGPRAYPGAGAGASPLGGQQTGGGAGASPLGGQSTGGGSANASVGCVVRPSSRGASPVDPSACCADKSTEGHLCTLVVGHNGDHAAIASDGASYLSRWA